MEEKFAQQLKKGVLDMVVLKLISRKQTYGYELLQELEQQGEGFFQLKEGTLYPVLYRLEDSGFIEASWKMSEGRTAPKKYYQITEEGKKQLAQKENEWKEYSQAIVKVMGGAIYGTL